MAKKFKFLFRPFKFANNKLRYIQDKDLLNLMVGAMVAFVTVTALLKTFWPIQNFWQFSLLTLSILFCVSLSVGFAVMASTFIVDVLIGVTNPFARLYDRLDQKPDDACGWGSAGRVNASAGLSLQYFIDRENSIKTVNRSRYLGES